MLGGPIQYCYGVDTFRFDCHLEQVISLPKIHLSVSVDQQEAPKSIMGHHATGLRNLLVLSVVILSQKLRSNQAHRTKCLRQDVGAISITEV